MMINDDPTAKRLTNEEYKKLEDLVYNYPTKNKKGFIWEEQNILLEQFPDINIDKFNAYIKTTVRNEPVKPFSMDLTKDMTKIKAQMNPQIAAAIIQLSRLKYGRSKELVEAEIAQRARL